MEDMNTNQSGELKTLSGASQSGAGKPAKDKPAKAEAPKKAAPKKRVDWNERLKKALMPMSVLFILLGLGIIAFNVLSIMNMNASADAAASVSSGMEIASIIIGVAMIVDGVLGLLKKSKRILMAIAVAVLVLAIIVLVGVIESGVGAILLSVAAIVFSVLFILAVDLAFEMGLVRFFREMLGELRKLTWLSGKDLLSHTAAVLAFVVVMALLIYVLDLAFSSGFSAISQINIG